MGKRLLRTREAAAFLSVSSKTIRKLIKTGRLKVIRFDESGPYLVDSVDLEKLIEREKRTED
jgi:excisionase family DNA binding protein